MKMIFIFVTLSMIFLQGIIDCRERKDVELSVVLRHFIQKNSNHSNLYLHEKNYFIENATFVF